MPARKRAGKAGADAPSPIASEVLAWMAHENYQPVDALTLCRALKAQLRRPLGEIAETLDALEASGKVARIKGDRYILPETADLLPGRINFRVGGSAWVSLDEVPDEPTLREIQVFQEDAATAMHGDRVMVRVDRSPRMHRGREVRTGRVIRILERANSTVVGALARGKHHFHVIPDDPRLIHDIVVPDPARTKVRPMPRSGDKVVVRLAEWKVRHAPPEGEIVEVLGRNTEPGTELRAIFLKHRLPDKFHEHTLAEVRHLADTVDPKHFEGREDFREIPTCTIDPDDAKDFDDALSLETLPNGSLRIGVHIADVSTYVRPGTALDKEARQRGNSTYLIGTVVPMLPEKLSNGLCSLVEGEDRLTKAAIFTFDRSGTCTDTRFANTVIRSRKRLTYKQAYALLREDDFAAIRRVLPPAAHQTRSTGRPLDSLSDRELAELQSMVRTFWRLAERLRADRMRKGSLDLEMPETKIFVDEKGWADRLERIEHDESHQLIEEFMLLANEAVAGLTRALKLPSVYRVHEEPDPAKLDEFREYAASMEVTTGALGRRENVVRLLTQLRSHPQGHLIRTQFLRSLRKARYAVEPLGHYGLHKKDYTHFTSPIRRYADLIVHRVLAHHIAQGSAAGRKQAKGPHAPSELRTLAEHISQTEIVSAEAEREHHKIKLVEFFERDLQRPTRTPFPAVITEIRNHGLSIELTEPFLPAFMHMSALRDDFYNVTADGAAVVGRRTKRRLELGQRIRVCIDRVDRIKRQFDFAPIPEETPQKPERRRRDLGRQNGGP